MASAGRPHHGARARHARSTLAPLLALVSGACVAPQHAAPEEHGDVALGVSLLTAVERQARAAQIRDAAFANGMTQGYLLAGIADAETSMSHCWSELTWACQGPASPDCGGGPVVAGAGDGPCSAQQGGLGMFQFDAGTHADTLQREGDRVLYIDGNVQAAVDFVSAMLIRSVYVEGVDDAAQAIAWSNGVRRDNQRWDAWISTVTHYYNGCTPSASCWSSRYAHYLENTTSVQDEMGAAFWEVSRDFAAEYVNQTFPLASQAFELQSSAELAGHIELRNVGTETWTPGATFIGTTQPRDGESPLAGADWIAPHRAATVDRVVAPGEAGRFAFTLQAPAQPGDYPQYFNLVQENVAWFGDRGGPPDDQLQVRVMVVAASEPAPAGEEPGRGADAGSGEGDGSAGEGTDAGRSERDGGDDAGADSDANGADASNGGSGCSTAKGAVAPWSSVWLFALGVATLRRRKRLERLHRGWRLVVLAVLGVLCASCGSDADLAVAERCDHARPVASAGHALSTIDCAESQDTGYSQGVPTAMTVVTVDGEKVERDTANAYYVMAQAADLDGVELQIVSGFRTMAEQERLYACYVDCNCNNCNLAAQPGYSNHQSGHALDLNASAPGVLAWLQTHGQAFGFEATVPSEDWHWEWWGGGPGGGPCGAVEYAGLSLGVSGQSYPIVSQGAVTVAVGETVSGWIRLENAGTATWQPGVVWLAPIPRDQASPFESASWLGPARISTVTAEVQPGGVGEFALDVTGKVAGRSILSLGWVAEELTWFADGPRGGGPDDGYFAIAVDVVDALDPPEPNAQDAAPPDAPSAAAGSSAEAGSADAGSVDAGAADAHSASQLSDDDGHGGCRSVPGASRAPNTALLCALLGVWLVRRRVASASTSSAYRRPQ